MSIYFFFFAYKVFLFFIFRDKHTMEEAVEDVVLDMYVAESHHDLFIIIREDNAEGGTLKESTEE